MCNIVDSVIHVQISSTDGGEVNLDMFQEVVLAEVRYFADEFNKKSTIAQMVLDDPIHVRGNWTISLLGVPNKMSVSDQEVFLSIVQTGMLALLKTKKDVVDFELPMVSIVFQESSSGSRLRSLRSLQDTDYNKLHVAVAAVCGDPDTCTDKALQALLSDAGPAFGTVLKTALKNPPASDILYFQNVQDVIVGESQTLPNLAPITVFEDDKSEKKQKFPKWLGILLFVSLLIGATLICLDMRRRRSEGDQKKDNPEGNLDQDEDSEYSERADKKFESEEVVQPQVNLLTVSGAIAGDDDGGSLGDEFSLDGGDISLAGPDQDAQFEPEHNPYNASFANGESFPAPRRTRQVNRGTSKRISRNHGR